jgi:hypothetical protein
MNLAANFSWRRRARLTQIIDLQGTQGTGSYKIHFQGMAGPPGIPRILVRANGPVDPRSVRGRVARRAVLGDLCNAEPPPAAAQLADRMSPTRAVGQRIDQLRQLRVQFLDGLETFAGASGNRWQMRGCRPCGRARCPTGAQKRLQGGRTPMTLGVKRAQDHHLARRVSITLCGTMHSDKNQDDGQASA